MTETKEPTKVCTKCKQEKPLSEFSKRAASKDGHCYTCKECDRVAAAKSYGKRKKVIKQRKYYEQNKDKHKERVRKNYEENKEKYREHHKKYREEHPEVGAAANKRRQERLAKVEREKYTLQELIARQTVNGVLLCAVCNEPLSLADLHRDHIIPIAEGGPDTKENVRLVHAQCNLRRPKDGSDIEGVEKQ